MSISAQQPPVVLDAPVTDQVIIPPETPQEIPKKEVKHIPVYLIVIIVVYVIGLYGFVGYTIYQKKNSQPDINTTTASLVTTPPALPALSQSLDNSSSSATTRGFNDWELAKIPLNDLTTNWWDWYTPRSQITNQFTDVVLPKEIVDKVALYQSEKFSYIAPKNWYADIDISAQYGDSSRAFPTDDINEKGPIIRVFFSHQAPKEGLIIASQFFPWIREHATELGIENNLLPPIKVSAISAVTPHLMLYSDTVDDTYEVHGAIYSNADQHLEDKQTEMMQMEVRLPKEDRDFAQQLIDVFVQQYNLKDK